MSSQTGASPAGTTAAPPTADGPVRTDDLELAINGMTCASCANRIERKLNKLEGSPRRSTTRPRRPRSPTRLG